MTVVTFLGMIGVEKKEDGSISLCDDPKVAEYGFSPPLKTAFALEQKAYRYENMLPLLLEVFPDADIVAVGTRDSHEAQERLLRKCHPALLTRGYEKVTIEDPHDYPAIFRDLADLLAKENDLVIDVSHSFRHLPSLMMVDMIMENIRHPGKIRHILFAKELKPSKKYIIVDLREYLTLANVSYALASFTKNYTIATTVRTVDELYQALLDELAAFGDHILANSLEALIFPNGDKPSVAKRILSIIEQVKVHESTRDLIHPLVPALDEIAEHMRATLRQADKPRDERFYYFATTMFSKGYLLNALTLVNEAAASYCVEGFRKIGETGPYVQRFETAIREGADSKVYNIYELTNIAKNIVKQGRKYKKWYYHEADTEIADAMIEHARDYIERNYRPTSDLRKFLIDCDNTRNNLAHANSARRLDKVRDEIKDLLIRYEDVCMIDDPLHRY